jgi:hypothetical protein
VASKYEIYNKSRSITRILLAILVGLYLWDLKQSLIEELAADISRVRQGALHEIKNEIKSLKGER